MKINICVPSYKRSDKVDVLSYLPSVRIYVDESEHKDYHLHYPSAKLVKMPKGIQGNISRVRNYILDDNRGQITCIVDDDLGYIGYFEKTAMIKLKDESEVMGFIYRYTELALSWGVKLWGVNVNPDKQAYREYSPFSTVSYIGSPFMVHLDTDLRFDENLPLKEDYDFTLQNLNKYRKVLRVNKYFYYVKQAEQVGGCAGMRNVDEEKRQFDLLRRKWGSSIIKADSLKSSRSHKSDKVRKFDINPVMVVPIRGI